MRFHSVIIQESMLPVILMTSSLTNSCLKSLVSAILEHRRSEKLNQLFAIKNSLFELVQKSTFLWENLEIPKNRNEKYFVSHVCRTRHNMALVNLNGCRLL